MEEQTVPAEHNANYTLLAKRKLASTYVKEIILKIDIAHTENFESIGMRHDLKQKTKL